MGLGRAFKLRMLSGRQKNLQCCHHCRGPFRHPKREQTDTGPSPGNIKQKESQWVIYFTRLTCIYLYVLPPSHTDLLFTLVRIHTTAINKRSNPNKSLVFVSHTIYSIDKQWVSVNILACNHRFRLRPDGFLYSYLFSFIKFENLIADVYTNIWKIKALLTISMQRAIITAYIHHLDSQFAAMFLSGFLAIIGIHLVFHLAVS